MKNSLRNLQLFAIAIFTILSAGSCSSVASVYRAGYSIGLDAIMGPNDKLRENGKMVVLVGPNGCGKTPVFEGLNHWYKYNIRYLQTFLTAWG